MRTLLKLTLGIAAGLNLLLVLEHLLQRATGYFVIDYSHASTGAKIAGQAILFTVFLLWAALFYLYKSKRYRRRRYVYAVVFPSVLLYSLLGFYYWIITFGGFLIVTQTAAHSSPSGQKEVLFKQMKTFRASIVKAYERKWIFQRSVLLEVDEKELYPVLVTAIDGELLSYQDAFFGPNIAIYWSQDEQDLRWTLTIEDGPSIGGTVVFD